LLLLGTTVAALAGAAMFGAAGPRLRPAVPARKVPAPA
jgi:hypothetical protein